MQFILDKAMTTSSRKSVFPISPRELESRKFYSLVGMLLACVAILLALGAKPVSIYHSSAELAMRSVPDSVQQAPVPNKPISLAQTQ